MAPCAHVETLPDPPPTVAADECAGCVAVGRSDWVHLRACLSCGTVGCCDSSPLRHATAHFEASGHPVMRSVEPGEEWRWCYVDGRIV